MQFCQVRHLQCKPQTQNTRETGSGSTAVRASCARANKLPILKGKRVKHGVCNAPGGVIGLLSGASRFSRQLSEAALRINDEVSPSCGPPGASSLPSDRQNWKDCSEVISVSGVSTSGASAVDANRAGRSDSTIALSRLL
jgi:hypothetical protein